MSTRVTRQDLLDAIAAHNAARWDVAVATYNSTIDIAEYRELHRKSDMAYVHLLDLVYAAVSE